MGRSLRAYPDAELFFSEEEQFDLYCGSRIGMEHFEVPPRFLDDSEAVIRSSWPDPGDIESRSPAEWRAWHEPDPEPVLDKLDSPKRWSVFTVEVLDDSGKVVHSASVRAKTMQQARAAIVGPWTIDTVGLPACRVRFATKYEAAGASCVPNRAELRKKQRLIEDERRKENYRQWKEEDRQERLARGAEVKKQRVEQASGAKTERQRKLAEERARWAAHDAAAKARKEQRRRERNDRDRLLDSSDHRVMRIGGREYTLDCNDRVIDTKIINPRKSSA